MKISDLARLSADNLRRRKGRTALTVVGVVVGTCAIVVMISLGVAMNKQNEEMLQSMGDLTKISVYNYGNNSGGATVLDDTALAEMQARQYVVAATPYYTMQNFNGSIKAGKNGRYQTEAYGVYGLYTDGMQDLGFQLLSGTWLSEETQYGKNKIPVLVGQNTGYNFIDSRRSPNSPSAYRYQGQTDAAGNLLEPFVDCENDKLTLSYTDGDGSVKASYELVVVGVLTEDYNKGWFTSSGFVMRMSDIRKLETAYRKDNKITTQQTVSYSEVSVKVDSVDHVAEVEKWIQDDLGFDTSSMTQIREELQSSVARTQMILGGLAAVSLFVAALNIMNTMTMAIYERTREIGVMKVLGCELTNIRFMFLMESGSIGFLGGVVGVAVSFVISLVLNNIATILALFGGNVDVSGLMNSLGGGYAYSGDATLSIIPPWLVLLALVFATTVGFVSGIAPAGRAVKISALEAIRHD